MDVGSGEDARGSAKYRFARVVSRITYPAMLSVPAFLVINLFLLPWPEWFTTSFLCILFATLIPMMMVFAWVRRIKQESINIPRKEDRTAPLLMITSSYLVGVIVLLVVGAPAITTCFMLCYLTNTLFVFAVNLRWKISIHSIGIAGPVVAMAFTFGLAGLVSGLLIPLVMWSRVTLKQHTVAQVVAGAGFGLLLTTVQFALLA